MKLFSTLFIGASLLVSFSSQAVVEISAGMQRWQTSVEGYVGEASDNLIDLEYADDSFYQFYVDLEHPLPLIPNVRLAHSAQEYQSQATLTSTYRLGSQLYNVASEMSFTTDNINTDIGLYYKVLDFSILEFDLGVNARVQNTDVAVSDSISSSASTREASQLSTMAFARLRSKLPLLGISSYLQVISGDEMTDYEAAIGYTIYDGIATDFNVYLGYRSQHIKLTGSDVLLSKADWEAVFVGLEVRL